MCANAERRVFVMILLYYRMRRKYKENPFGRSDENKGVFL